MLEFSRAEPYDNGQEYNYADENESEFTEDEWQEACWQLIDSYFAEKGLYARHHSNQGHMSVVVYHSELRVPPTDRFIFPARSGSSAARLIQRVYRCDHPANCQAASLNRITEEGAVPCQRPSRQRMSPSSI